MWIIWIMYVGYMSYTSYVSYMSIFKNHLKSFGVDWFLFLKIWKFFFNLSGWKTQTIKMKTLRRNS